MKLYYSIIVLKLLFLPISVFGQVTTHFNDVLMNESFESAYSKLKDISKTVITFTTNHPTFPLAKEKEAHIVCKQLSTSIGVIEKAVFSFGDNELKYIEVNDLNINKLVIGSKELPESFLGYEFYKNENLFIKQSENVAWILTNEALHPHLFIWRNPYLKAAENNNNDSMKIPEFLEKGLGADFDSIRPLIEAKSSFIDLKKLDNKDPYAQLQLNAYGVKFMGIPRKIEARFGNNKLNVVWILTSKQEEERVKSTLIEQFGEPIFSNNYWVVFNDWQVALRKDKSEVLLLTKEMGKLYKESFLNSKN